MERTSGFPSRGRTPNDARKRRSRLLDLLVGERPRIEPESSTSNRSDDRRIGGSSARIERPRIQIRMCQDDHPSRKLLKWQRSASDLAVAASDPSLETEHTFAQRRGKGLGT